MTPDYRERGYLEDLLTAAGEVAIVVTEAEGLMWIDLHEDVPLWVDEEHGVIRIPGTRLKLETVIHRYYEGCNEPEEIV
ncbi:MAG: hypothetical protein OXI56_01460 [bacterium]|nr:hypothetical protein [bacterium]MDE0600442.1 hypothetical protein [bacterium]